MSAPERPQAVNVALHQAPAPLPTTVQVHTVMSTQGKRVALWVHTPAGVTVVFLDGDTAETVGLALTREGRQARTGLHLPANGKVP